jgi:hypothetical protein
MSGYKDLEIYRLAFDLSIRVHRSSLKLPKFEMFEQGSQIRRSRIFLTPEPRTKYPAPILFYFSLEGFLECFPGLGCISLVSKETQQYFHIFWFSVTWNGFGSGCSILIRYYEYNCWIG